MTTFINISCSADVSNDGSRVCYAQKKYFQESMSITFEVRALKIKLFTANKMHEGKKKCNSKKVLRG